MVLSSGILGLAAAHDDDDNDDDDWHRSSFPIPCLGTRSSHGEHVEKAVKMKNKVIFFMYERKG